MSTSEKVILVRVFVYRRVWYTPSSAQGIPSPGSRAAAGAPLIQLPGPMSMRGRSAFRIDSSAAWSLYSAEPQPIRALGAAMRSG